jgi:hypothetical protein
MAQVTQARQLCRNSERGSCCGQQTLGHFELDVKTYLLESGTVCLLQHLASKSTHSITECRCVASKNAIKFPCLLVSEVEIDGRRKMLAPKHDDVVILSQEH